MQIQLPTPAPTPQVITVEPEKKETNINSYALIGALALAVIGGGWYFKVYKPKHEDYDDDDEGMYRRQDRQPGVARGRIPRLPALGQLRHLHQQL